MGIHFDTDIASSSFSGEHVSWTISLGEKLQTGGTKSKSYAWQRRGTSNQDSSGYGGKSLLRVLVFVHLQ